MFTGFPDDMYEIILLTIMTAARNEVALICYKVRGLYVLAVIFVATITITSCKGLVKAVHFS